MTNSKPRPQGNDEVPTSNASQSSDDRKKYDLEERTAQFGGAVTPVAKTLPQDAVNSPLISQLARAATSIGTNCMEAGGAGSKRDFQHKLSICKKEAYFLLSCSPRGNPAV